ncbi:PAS domain-containing protein [Novosphingobium sp. APW14]|uniref:PAS domain-containing protein n=1 Tax=Novosphingobium sp. APW14 TaxID=3077237 RepID=UPI0028E45142|nr:PAS domain-containing protein [Novosphingobium sp. APW14]
MPQEMVAKHTNKEPRPALSAQGGARQRNAVHDRSLVDDNWRLMAPVMAAVGLVTAASNGIVLSLTSIALLAVAIWLVWTIRRVNAREQLRSHDELRRQILHGLHISMPMLLFGMAIGWWTEKVPMINWRDTISAPIIVSALAAVILNRRSASILAATVSIWLGVALVAGNLKMVLILAGGATIGIHAAIRQVRSDRVAAEIERQRRHNQLRAEQLLNEFEESGQGWFFETDRRGALLYISPIVSKVLGRGPQHLIGQPFSELFQPDAEEGERTLTFHLTARSAFNELALRANFPGEERWWSISGRPLHDEFGSQAAKVSEKNDRRNRLSSSHDTRPAG